MKKKNKKYSFKWNEAERLLYLTFHTIVVHADKKDN